MQCCHRFDEDYVPKEHHVAAAIREQEEDAATVWYADSGVTDHIAGELEKLAIHEKYFSNDQVHTTPSGGGMGIHHVGQASIYALFLNGIFH